MSRRLRSMAIPSSGAGLWGIPPVAAPVARRPSLAHGWRGSFTTSATTLQTALSITGRAGMIQALACSGGAFLVELVVDGVLLHHGGSDQAAGNLVPSMRGIGGTAFLAHSGGAVGGWEGTGSVIPFAQFNFLTSVVLRVQSTGGAAITLQWSIEGVPV